MRVHVGRWQDTLPGTYDPEFAVVITDPPYGLASDGSGNGAPGVHSRGKRQLDTRARYDIRKGYEDTIPWAQHVAEVLEHHREPPQGDAVAFTRFSKRDQRDYRPRTDHRALTPFAAASWIIDTWVDPGCIVIDPFAGLGTIGLAARTLGFDYIGAELVPEYAAVANEAFASERLTLGLSA